MNENRPLADKLRPLSFKDFFGQEHLVGKNGFIRKLLSQDNIPSIIFWGPPGSGKTTLAQVIANSTKSHFEFFSAVTTKVEDIRRVVAEAKERLSLYNQKTILFLDEIHRFNKAQQAAFLPHVENGTIILIGATTENPSFEVIGPLLSRCKVLVLNQLTEIDLEKILNRGLKELKVKINKETQEFLIQQSNGDARILLNALEIGSNLIGKSPIRLLSTAIIEQALQSKQLLYDKAAEEHYNAISCLHKSMRGNDPDAAIYYCVRMLEAGEDPLYIARRLIRFASEDIGNAAPHALTLAVSAFTACHYLGMPECGVILVQLVAYLATCKKSNACYVAEGLAKDDVRKFGNLPFPLKLRNPVTKLMKDLNYGQGYKYAHNFTDEELKGEVYLPEELKGKKYYFFKKNSTGK